MKKIKRFALLFLVFTNGLYQFAFGWGEYGHKVVAAIAERLVAPETKNEIRSILGDNTSLVDIATWADEIRRRNSVTAKWHYVDMPKESNEYVPERDCPKGKCLIESIENFRNVLSDKRASKDKREKALKFLVHFIGDLHQPLHCGYPEDRGGNEIIIKFFTKKSNLHEVWDEDILLWNKIEFKAYVEKQIKRTTPNIVETLKKGTVLDWFYESRNLLKNHVYAFGSDKRLGQEYCNKNRPVIHDQLLKAGIRLSGVLDKALSEEKK